MEYGHSIKETDNEYEWTCFNIFPLHKLKKEILAFESDDAIQKKTKYTVNIICSLKNYQFVKMLTFHQNLNWKANVKTIVGEELHFFNILTYWRSKNESRIGAKPKMIV